MSEPTPTKPDPAEQFPYDGEATVTFFPFAYLLIATETAREAYTLTLTHGNGIGANYHLVTAVVFSAFSVEAALNQIGEAKICGWEDRAKWEDKLKLVATTFKPDLDMGKKPVQRVKQAFQFRDKMAHGKTTVQQRTYRVIPGKERPNTTDPDWLAKYFNPDEVDKVIADTRELITTLWTAAGFSPESIAVTGSTSSKETPRVPPTKPDNP